MLLYYFVYLFAGLKPTHKSTLPPDESVQCVLKSVALDSNQNTFDNHKNCKTKERYHPGEKSVSLLRKDKTGISFYNTMTM